MSSAAAKKRSTEFSRWVAPDVGAATEAQAPVSEELVEDIKRQAQQSGYEEGYRSGLQNAQQQVDEQLAVLSRLIDHVSDPLPQVELQTMETLVDLALGVSQMLVEREISLDASLVLSAVKAGLASLPDHSGATKICINPSDLEVVSKAYTSGANAVSPLVVADASVVAGGAVIELDSTVVDAQLTARLEQIRESITAASVTDDE